MVTKVQALDKTIFSLKLQDIATAVILLQGKHPGKRHTEDLAKKNPDYPGMGNESDMLDGAAGGLFQHRPAALLQIVKAFSPFRSETGQIFTSRRILAGKAGLDLTSAQPFPEAEIDFRQISDNPCRAAANGGCQYIGAFPAAAERAGKHLADGLQAWVGGKSLYLLSTKRAEGDIKPADKSVMGRVCGNGPVADEIQRAHGFWPLPIISSMVFPVDFSMMSWMARAFSKRVRMARQAALLPAYSVSFSVKR